MRLANLLCVIVLSASAPLSQAGTETKPVVPKMSVEQIVDKNVQARGGLAAWRSVHTLEMKGKLEAGGNQRASIAVPNMEDGVKVATPRPKTQALLPFVLDLQRGRKMRLELEFKGQTAVQVYDGTNGWKLRPFLNRHEVEHYSAQELKAASTQAELDGFLIDYAAKREIVELVGTEQVNGRGAYRLKVTDKNQTIHQIWVDAETFLEVKIDGTPRRLDGKYHNVATYFRDYRTVDGLVMPFVLETVVEGVKDTEKILIEKIVSNPKLEESKFAMPL